ncbi:hypothetical protein K1T71_014910 [Dendrolimus kikuchii]|nr:hypothetical protein K1T71_014910 [Dendrolimus kikuchii]
MAERPKKPAASRDPRLAYRPIVTTTPATTSVTTPPTSGGAPLVPPGYYHPTGDERGSRQAGEKGRRSSSSEDEDEPRKRRDTAKTPSPTGPEEGGGEEMASSSSASSSTSSSQASADSTPPSRSTSYVELESLRAAGVANPAETETGGTAAAMSVTAAVGRRDTAAGNQGRPSLGTPTSINISFAEAAALPRASPTPLPRTSPRPGTSRTSPMPTATSTPGHDGQVAPPAPSTTKAKNYPPLIVDKMPNWTAHFQKLHDLLGHAPNGRPFGQGVRFIPHSPEEFRTIQKYLSEATQADPAVQWFCYSADAEKPAKVAIRGLPPDTDPEEIKRALTELDFAVETVRHIPGVRGRPGCLFHVALKHLNQEELSRLYSTNELLYMPGVVIEAWRGQHIVAQCHRCQKFGHSSRNCHRPARCLRCAGEHLVADCPKPRTEETCANCGKAHAASYRRCPALLKEQRRKRAAHPPPPLTARPRQPRQPAGNRPLRPTRAERRRAQAPLPAEPSPAPEHRGHPRETDVQTAHRTQGVTGTTLAPPANDPVPRSAPPQKRKTHRGGRKHRKKSRGEELTAETRQPTPATQRTRKSPLSQ